MANSKYRRHKIKPQPPNYEAYGLFDDNCYYCVRNRKNFKCNNCNQCKIAKQFKRSRIQAIKYRRKKGEFKIWGQEKLLI